MLKSFHKVWLLNKLEGFRCYHLSDWGYMNFYIGKFLQVFYFPSTAVVKKKILKRNF